MSRGGPSLQIGILLSAYNGEQYLKEQLDSFLAQSYSHWVVLWRDDGSSDSTVRMLEEFGSLVGPGRCRRAGNSGEHLGVMESFLSLLREAVEYPLLAFSDQDDVWLPGKLANAVEFFLSRQSKGPALYCGRQIIVDKELRRLGYSFPVSSRMEFPSALVQNIATGCTTVINRAAADVISRIRPPRGSVHDWWAYIVVSALGGEVYFDNTPGILYRQHGRNAIGASQSFVARGLQALRRGSGPFVRTLAGHLEALHDARGDLPRGTADMVSAIRLALNGGATRRVVVAMQTRMRRVTVWETAVMVMWLIRGA